MKSLAAMVALLFAIAAMVGAFTLLERDAPREEVGVDLKQWIEETRENFENARRDFTYEMRRINQLRTPVWMFRLEDLGGFSEIYRDQNIIFEHGRVVWAVLVIANEKLFSTGMDNHPGVVLYSLDPYYDEYPHGLQALSEALLEETADLNPSKDSTDIATVLENEYRGMFNKMIPRSWTNGREVYIASLVFSREHLPNGYIQVTYFPLLACPERSRGVIMLPSYYWSRGVLTEWEEAEAESAYSGISE